jgi:hypothetical protein
MSMDRAALMSALDLKSEAVEIAPGDFVTMAELSVAERERVRGSIKGLDEDAPEFAFRVLLALVVASLRSDDGSVMFPPEEWTEATDALLTNASAAPVGRMVDACQRIQGLGEDALKEEVGNSEASPSDASCSGSPETSDSPAVAPSPSA